MRGKNEHMLFMTYFISNAHIYAIRDIKEISHMQNEDLSSIFEQINNLKRPAKETEKGDMKNDSLRDVLEDVSAEIKRIMTENDFTQEDLCKITNMSQSNISKILNCKVIPKIETLEKIAAATHTKLTISFEGMEGDN